MRSRVVPVSCECRDKGWVKITAITGSTQRAELTPVGRMTMTQGLPENT